jgi:hypothetical protein
MDPAVFLIALLILVGVPAFTVIKITRLRAARPESFSADVGARLEELERGVQASNRSWQKHRSDSISRSACSARQEKSGGSAARVPHCCQRCSSAI